MKKAGPKWDRWRRIKRPPCRLRSPWRSIASSSTKHEVHKRGGQVSHIGVHRILAIFSQDPYRVYSLPIYNFVFSAALSCAFTRSTYNKKKKKKLVVVLPDSYLRRTVVRVSFCFFAKRCRILIHRCIALVLEVVVHVGSPTSSYTKNYFEVIYVIIHHFHWCKVHEIGRLSR